MPPNQASVTPHSVVPEKADMIASYIGRYLLIQISSCKNDAAWGPNTKMQACEAQHWLLKCNLHGVRAALIAFQLASQAH
jgi:hypothetical protein